MMAVEIDEIRHAFPLAPIPCEIFRVDGNAGDIADELRQRILGHKWDEISLVDWANIASPVAVAMSITPKAFHYYLPSLLYAVWDDRSYIEWGVYAVVPSNKNHVARSAWWKEYIGLFTEDQREIVKKFLEHARDVDESCGIEAGLANEALDQIWNAK